MTNEEARKRLLDWIQYATDPERVPFMDEPCSDEEIILAMRIGADALSQSSLPSDLDEAAEEYIKFKPRYDIQQELEEWEDPTEIDCFTIDAAIDSFKDGAEWMAEQGVSMLGRVGIYGVDVESITKELREAGFNLGEEIILQIRKKQ